MNTEVAIKEANAIINSEGNQKFEVRPGIDMSKLIGNPHLFGRVIETREGFLVDPIGTLTLQPNGRITDYSNPNEGSWIPYDHGTVSSDKGFAFITSMNSWIPTSTWQQSMGDIAIGHFCNESEGIKKLCLIPKKIATKKEGRLPRSILR